CETKFMDRTAWIVVALCVVGLVLWEFYLAKQMATRPAPVTAAPGQPSPSVTQAILTASPSPLATPQAESPYTDSVPYFAVISYQCSYIQYEQNIENYILDRV